MSENVYRRARIPFHYPIVFLLNIALIIALEVLLIYRYPMPITETLLAEQSAVYENASIIGDDYSSYVHWYLVETDSGEYHLIPVHSHILFHDRCKLLNEQIVVIPPDTAQMEVQTRTGITASSVLVGTEVEPWGEDPASDSLQLRSKYRGYSSSSANTYTIGGYFLLGILMSVLEAALWNVLKPK